MILYEFVMKGKQKFDLSATYCSGVDLSYNLEIGVSQVKPSSCFRLHPTSNDFQTVNNTGS